MIPSQTLEEFEPFAELGDKVAPVPAKYAQGYLPGEVFPAQHENFLMGKASRCSTQHRAGIRSIEAELNNVVDAGGAEPDDTDDTQVLDAINYLIAQAVAAEREKEMPKGFLWWTSTPPTSPGGNPNTLFPGTTWVRLKDAFVWAAGDNDTVTPAVAGTAKTADGGSATRKIETSNLPPHTHELNGTRATTSSTGGWFFRLRRFQEGTESDTIIAESSHSNNITITRAGGSNVSGNRVYRVSNTNPEYTLVECSDHSHTLSGNTTNGGFANTALDIKNPYINRYCWERVS